MFTSFRELQVALGALLSCRGRALAKCAPRKMGCARRIARFRSANTARRWRPFGHISVNLRARLRTSQSQTVMAANGRLIAMDGTRRQERQVAMARGRRKTKARKEQRHGRTLKVGVAFSSSNNNGQCFYANCLKESKNNNFVEWLEIRWRPQALRAELCCSSARSLGSRRSSFRFKHTKL